MDPDARLSVKHDERRGRFAYFEHRTVLHNFIIATEFSATNVPDQYKLIGPVGNYFDYTL